ncbi:sensor histidine kinase [Terrimonas sp. NA20]|uniref:Sensor histidine kinase n=1 Tax=Terrimonas ginsenosidimutans TaxID=2908004 RepID=A0ABS9KVR3_9BACT|nr:sensor histidine kinase [Terrimonas ginsenosidimutans]MCG2616395.1 sensor histidine kinase [Terrimonas ginsenosidimutans]
MQKLTNTIFLLFFVAIGQGQALPNLDSLLKLVPAAKEDSGKVLLYINIGQQYESNHPEIAKQYYREAGALSRKINYPAGIIKYINNYTFVLNMQGQFDSSLLLNKQAVEIARETKDSINLGKALFNTGTSYRVRSDFESAIRYYEEGKKVFERHGSEETQAIANDILQLLYYSLEQFDKAIEYGTAAVTYLRKVQNLPFLATAASNLGISYARKHEYEKAKALFNETYNIGLKIHDLNAQGSSMLNLGDIALQQSRYSELEKYFSKAEKIFLELDAKESLVISYRGLAIYYLFQRNYPVAAKYGEQGLAITNELNLAFEKRKTLETLSSIYIAMQDIEKGEEYLRMSTRVGDSLLSETIQKNTIEIEKKFEAEKKETQIKALTANQKVQQLSIERKNFLNKILLAAGAAVVIISLLAYRNYKQKQKIQEQRIAELETEKKLAATEAVLKGEEQERTRLAKDLHDGLGGMLSGIKYSFSTMKGNLIMTPENARAFERSMDMLDSSIAEMRRVAHNMMPEALVKFGLDTALKDFCNDINQSGALKVTYQSIGLENLSIDQTTAITIYRISQELLNNIMKHAAAKTAIVQLSHSEDTISLTVEDDGKGFDISILNGARGIGWTNIQTRVEYLKGKTDIQSAPQKGTSIHIELKTS